MKKKFSTYWIWTIFFAICFVAFAGVVGFVDVAAIGPNETSVGLSHINGKIHDKIGVHMNWFDITDTLGKIALCIAGVMALCGLIQLIVRRSLKKMDKEIISLGVIYVITAIIYVAFEKIIINYRPVILPGDTAPEASFPSSHTMLSCVILGTGIVLCSHYIKNAGLKFLASFACIAMMLVIIGGRFYSGVHWFTDIVGGALIGFTLIFAYAAVNDASVS